MYTEPVGTSSNAKLLVNVIVSIIKERPAVWKVYLPPAPLPPQKYTLYTFMQTLRLCWHVKRHFVYVLVQQQ